MPLSRLLPCLALLAASSVWGQGQVFRCANEYTNDPRRAEDRQCQVLESLPVTVPGTQVRQPPPSPQTTPAAAGAPASAMTAAGAAARPARVASAEQQARDAQARLILEAELRKAQAELARLQAEFKDGAPDKQGIEGRNHQRYLDRVQALREALVRQQADVDSLQRELARHPADAGSVASRR